MQTLSVSCNHSNCFDSVVGGGVFFFLEASVFCTILLFPKHVELQKKIPVFLVISQIFSEELTFVTK